MQICLALFFTMDADFLFPMYHLKNSMILCVAICGREDFIYSVSYLCDRNLTETANSTNSMVVLKRQIRSASKALPFPSSVTFYTPWPATRLQFFSQIICDQMVELQPVLPDTKGGKASPQKVFYFSVQQYIRLASC